MPRFDAAFSHRAPVIEKVASKTENLYKDYSLDTLIRDKIKMIKKLLIPALIVASMSGMTFAQDRGNDNRPNQYRPDDFPGSNNQGKANQGAASGAKDARGNEYRPDDFPGSNNHTNATRGNQNGDAGNKGSEYRPDDFPGSNNRGKDYRPGRPQFAHDRGAGPRHDLRKGSRLPDEYRSPQYVVDDWRGHHLKKPRRGYQWVQTGNDYLLVAVATGVIASVLLSQ
jgi:Ni/Co efflux regulator RcnB